MMNPDDRIGPYKLVRQIGRGSFKEVWLAEKRTRYVTTSVALGIPLEPDPDVEAIQQEADAWIRAGGHPNILPVIDVDEYDGQIVIVSEYASGGTLKEWLKRNGGKAPSTDVAYDMMMGILAGLQHLHAIPMVHRDMKPGNVLLQGDTPRLTDFGLARVLNSTGYTQTLAGTLEYMSPETLEGHFSPHSDLWAASVILYRMISGRLPFPQKDPYELEKAIMERSPEPLGKDVPGWMRRIVSLSLEKNLDERPESAASMRSQMADGFLQSSFSMKSRPVEDAAFSTDIDSSNQKSKSSLQSNKLNALLKPDEDTASKLYSSEALYATVLPAHEWIDSPEDTPSKESHVLTPIEFPVERARNVSNRLGEELDSNTTNEGSAASQQFDTIPQGTIVSLNSKDDNELTWFDVPKRKRGNHAVYWSFVALILAAAATWGVISLNNKGHKEHIIVKQADNPLAEAERQKREKAQKIAEEARTDVDLATEIIEKNKDAQLTAEQATHIQTQVKTVCEKALSGCTAALKLDPKNLVALRVRAIAYFLQDDYQRAELASRKGGELYPNDEIFKPLLERLIKKKNSSAVSK